MPSSRSPRQRGREPAEGALYIEDVVAHNARARRQAMGMSQENLAKRMCILGYTWNQNAVSMFEAGNRDVRLRELLGLALVLEVSPTDLMNPRAAGWVALDLAGPGELDSGVAEDWLTRGAAFRLEWTGDTYREDSFEAKSRGGEWSAVPMPPAEPAAKPKRARKSGAQ